MAQSEIIRLSDRDVWEIADTIQVIHKMPKENLSQHDTNSLCARGRELSCQLEAEFRYRMGWQRSTIPFTLRQLSKRSNQQTLKECEGRDRNYYTILDHAHYYKKDKRPIAIVVHDYNFPATAQDIVEAAAENNIAWSQIRDFPSWHLPGYTTMLIYYPVG